MKRIAWTGPSKFDVDGVSFIEEGLNANPIILRQNSLENLHDSLSQCDAVILAGGIDLHPTTYQQNVHSKCNMGKFDIKRDSREVNILRYCQENKIPVLGICRGHQLLGVYHGLELIQDINDSAVVHSPGPNNIYASKEEPLHSVELTAEGKNWYGTVGQQYDNTITEDKEFDYLYVNSFHHQGLKKTFTKSVQTLGTADISTPKATSATKVEIIELMQNHGNDWNWLSCQWHPEWDWRENIASSKIIEKFDEIIRS